MKKKLVQGHGTTDSKTRGTDQQPRGVSGYIGITWVKRQKKWQVII